VPVVVSIPPLDSEQTDFQFVPNPHKDHAFIECHNLKEDAFLIVYDALGKKVFETNLSANQRKERVETNGWSAGLYFFKVVGQQAQMILGNGSFVKMR